MRTLLVICLMSIALGALAAPPVTFTLKEYLGEAWTAERVTFPATLPDDLLNGSLAVRDAGGMLLPAQFTPEQPGSRAGTVSFIVDLPAHGQQTWTLLPGPRKNTQMALFCAVTQEDVTFGTPRIAVRCPAGAQAWPDGIAATDAPAPLLGYALEPDVWIGGSRLASPLQVRSFTGAVVENGPVSVKYRMTYTFEGEKTWSITLEALAGQDVILVTEEANLNEKTQFLEGIRPAGAPEGNYTVYAFGKRLQERGSYWTLALDGMNADRVAWQPTGNTWGAKPADGEPWGTFPRPAEAGPIAVLNPTHGEWWMNCSQWVGVYAQNRQPFLGLLALNAGLWKIPHENTIVLENDAQGKLRALLPINTGSRRWALYASTRDAATAIPGEEPSGEEYPGRQHARPPHLATIKHGLLPLDTVKDWAFEFPDPKGTVFPHVFSQAAELPAIRKRIADTPSLNGNVQKLKVWWDNYRRTNDPNYPLYKMRRMYPKGLDNIYLATGDEQYAAAMAALLLDRLHYYVHQTKAGVGVTGYRWSHGYGMFHLTTGVLPYCLKEADLALGSPGVLPAQKAEIRALMAFWGELLASRDYAPPGYNHGNTDMVASWATTVGAFGCLLNGHPRAKAWADIAVRDVDHALKSRWHLPDYSQDEWYGQLTLDMCTGAAIMLKQAGFHDYFKDPRFRDGLDFYGQLLAPADPRYGFGYIVPFGNGQGHWNRSAMWALAASATKRDDPAFAGRMMWYWERAGRPGTLKYGDRDDFGWSTLGWLDPTIPAKNPELASTWLKDWGIVFRGGCGTPRETYMALQMGKPAGLAGYNAEGGFHLYAQGMPLSLIFGIRSYDVSQHKGAGNSVLQRWMANRPSFDNRSERENGTGKVLEWAPSSSADYVCGEWTFSRLQAMVNPRPSEGDARLILSKPRWEPAGLEPNVSGPISTVKPIIWRRQVLFVKSPDPAGPNYVVIRDTAKTTVPWDWSVWALSSDEQVKDGVATFTGKFGVDLDVVPLTPAPEIVTGAYGPTKSFAGDYRQQLYQVQLPGKDGEFAAVLYPRKHGEPAPTISPSPDGQGVRITLPEETHQVLLTESGAAVLRERGKQTTIALFGVMNAGVFNGCTARITGEKLAGSLTATFADGAITGDAYGPQREVTLEADMAMATLTIDGKPAQPAEIVNGKVRFTIPAGDHVFVVK